MFVVLKIVVRTVDESVVGASVIIPDVVGTAVVVPMLVSVGLTVVIT